MDFLVLSEVIESVALFTIFILGGRVVAGFGVPNSEIKLTLEDADESFSTESGSLAYFLAGGAKVLAKLGTRAVVNLMI